MASTGPGREGGNAAVYYYPEGYSLPASGRILGRQSAGSGFLRGLFRHGGAGPYYCFTSSQDAFDSFRAAAAGANPAAQVEWLPCSAPERLAGPGALYVPGPSLAPHAWRRREDPAAYSLTGITHTLCSKQALGNIADLLTAPLQPWDALICTSTAARDVVGQVLDGWAEYLAGRFSIPETACRRPLTPVIPLGVDCDSFDSGEAERQNFRWRHGIGDDDVMVLYVGRLSVHAKSHPQAMYLALEKVAAGAGVKICLVMAGWTANKTTLAEFKRGAELCCPSVRVLILDGQSPRVIPAAWAAADIFCSLPDNIQETFGLTPVEAQAAGLPVVVSDWDGYRDTVVDGATGFLVPTVMPGAGSGEALAWRYLAGEEDYDAYVGKVSQCVAVDVDAAARALADLVADPALREKMGEAGRRHARENHDWRYIIRRYRELWCELEEERDAARPKTEPVIGTARPSPLLADPFAVFAGHPSRRLEPGTMLTAAVDNSAAVLRARRGLLMNRFADDVLASPGECEKLLTRLEEAGPCRVADLLKPYAGDEQSRLLRTLGWLLKQGIVRIED